MYAMCSLYAIRVILISVTPGVTVTQLSVSRLNTDLSLVASVHQQSVCLFAESTSCL